MFRKDVWYGKSGPYTISGFMSLAWGLREYIERALCRTGKDGRQVVASVLLPV